MTASNTQRNVAWFGRVSLTILVACGLSATAWAESKPGYRFPAAKRKARKKVVPEKRHDPTALDRRLLPAPNFGANTAPVGGLMVDEAHWNPFDPTASKKFTINGGSSAGLRKGDRLLVWRGRHQTVVAEVEVIALAEEKAHVRVLRRPDPSKVLPLELQAVMTGDRVSLLMRSDAAIWPQPKKKRRRRRIIRKKSTTAQVQKAAEPQALPPGKDTIVIGGRELPKASAKDVRLTPAQLPEVKNAEPPKPNAQ